jgi:hypothetical protein
MGIFGFLKKLLPTALSLIPGVGGIAGTVASSLLGGGGGGGGEELRNSVQAERDMAKARALSGESLDVSREAADIARGEWETDEPLRADFREGALNFGSAANPFAMRGGAPTGGSTTGGDMASMMSALSPQGGAGGGIGEAVSSLVGGGPQAEGPMGGIGGMIGKIMGGGAPGGPMDTVTGGGGSADIIRMLLGEGGIRGRSFDEFARPGYAPSTGLGGTGGYTPPPPSLGGAAEMQLGMPPSETGSIGARAATLLAGGPDFQQRFGTQERGSSTDFLTPSRRASAVKRSV